MQNPFKKIAVVISIASLMAATGCQTWPVKPLTQDKLRGAGESSVLIMQFKATCPSGMYNDAFRWQLPQLLIYDLTDTYPAKWVRGEKYGMREEKRYDHHWQVEDDTAYFEDYYIVECLPGDYLIQSLVLFTGETGGSTSSTRHYRTYDLHRKIRVEPDKAYYVITLDMAITEVSGEYPVSDISAGLSMYQAPQNAEESFSYFKSQYPQAYSQMESSIETAEASQYIVTHFGASDFEIGHDNFRFPLEFLLTTLKGYRIDNTDDKYIERVAANRTVFLPADFDIEWNSIWLSGKQEEGYGLLLGSDTENCYMFCASQDGRTAVFMLEGNAYGESPLYGPAGSANVGDTKTENQHRIEKRGDLFSYYVNNQRIGEFTSQLDTVNWQIGLMVPPQTKVAFSKLVIAEK